MSERRFVGEPSSVYRSSPVPVREVWTSSRDDRIRIVLDQIKEPINEFIKQRSKSEHDIFDRTP